MPQGPFQVKDYMDASSSILNITASTALRTSAARLVTVSVLAAATATTPTTIFDGTASVGSRAALVIPATVGLYPTDWQFSSGIFVLPGAGMTLAISLA